MYSIHSRILSHWRHFRIGDTSENLGALTTARATEFCISCRRFIWDWGKIKVDGVAVVKFRVNNQGGDSNGSFMVKIRMNAAKLTHMTLAIFTQCTMGCG